MKSSGKFKVNGPTRLSGEIFWMGLKMLVCPYSVHPYYRQKNLGF